MAGSSPPLSNSTGDALTGAFLALWVNGVAPADALRYACAAGSLVVTRTGAQELRPTSEDLTRLVPSAARVAEMTATTRSGFQE